VADAVVIAREDASGDRRLVAYVVAGEGRAPTVSELREALSRDLAEYMIPSAFVTLDALPLTPNGKLDRKALPAPDASAVLSREYEAPMGEVEQAIAAIWKELLGLEQVGRNDHFFELGGHSLLAARVLAELRARFAIEVSIRDVFERTTVRTLADYLAERLLLTSLKQDLALDIASSDDQELTEL
jgi:acyl carrier protein